MDTLKDLPVSREYPALEVRYHGDDEDLVLRPTRMGDAEAITAAIQASLPALREFMPWAHKPQTALSQLERLRIVETEYFSGRELVLGLFAQDQSFRCMVGLHPRVPLNPRGLEVGYWAPTPVTGKGWTTLGVKLVLCYAFDRLGCDRLQVLHDEANVASRRVIEKCGFVREATLRGMTYREAPELHAQGFLGTDRHGLWAQFPDGFAALPWVPALRARVTYVNLAGYPEG
jgi:RimJ/RimL family protein N-acetyltransferase